MERIALLGAGFIGATHAEAISWVKKLELAAVLDVNEKAGRELARKFNCKYYSCAKEIFSDKTIGIVDICLPTYLHEQYVVLAAQYGKHVLLEKPFALSKKSCERMRAACHKAGVKLMIAQVVRWFPEFIEIKKIIDKKMLGNIHMIYASRLAQHPSWTTWHNDPIKSGGGLFDLHSHDIDYLFYLFGPVERIYSTGWKSKTGCWNHVITSIIFCNGIKAVAEGSMEMTGNYPFSVAFRASGDSGTLEYGLSSGVNLDNANRDNKLVLYMVNKDPMLIETGPENPYESEISAFAAAVISNAKSPVLPADSAQVIGIIEAIRESLETGMVIKM